MIDIVYPLKRSSWDKEILFSLRSLEQYFTEPCQVHICGDYLPSWLVDVNYQAFTFSSDKHTDANIAPILAWACKQFDNFIWLSDDIYFLKPTSVADLLPHPHIGFMTKDSFRGNGPWAKRLWQTFDLLDAAGITPIYNHITHTPSLYNSVMMQVCAAKFPVFSGEVLHEVVYYNTWAVEEPPKLIEKAGFYSKGQEININDPKYRFLNHDDRGLSPELKQAIESKFNIKSKYER